MRLLPLLALILCAAAPTASLATVADEQKSAQKQRRILYNCDGCSCMFYKKDSYKPTAITEDDLRNVVGDLTQPGSQVDTFLLCVNAQSVYYPSKVGTMLGSLIAAKGRGKIAASSRQWTMRRSESA